jgi:hypothetical protein
MEGTGMSKGPKNSKPLRNNLKIRNKEKPQVAHSKLKDDSFLISMSHAPGIQESTGWFQMIPVIFFTAVTILITRMAVYERPMNQFYFWSSNSKLTDFFSYYKMYAILICTVIVLVILLYRVFIQSFYIKRSFAYIPMFVYVCFVALSYFFSDYKLFALWGWNDRFEGTLTLLAYMIMLFYIINSVNSEKNIKWIVYALAAISSLLGLLGISQAAGHDFFRTIIGKKLITPAWFWDQVNSLNFTFQNNEIYQTVYNINYVSFYLTLLIPLFGLLFIRSAMLGKDEPLYKKLIWGALFALLLYNLIGSASSSGLMGMAAVVLIAVIVLNKKIIQWGKPVIILLIITLAVGWISYERWSHELSGAIEGVSGGQMDESIADQGIHHKLDSIETTEDKIILGYNGDTLVFITYPDDPSSITILDSKESPIPAVPSEEDPLEFRLNDVRYEWISVKPAKDKAGNDYVILLTDGNEWPFRITDNGPQYYNGNKKLVDLSKVESIGFENNSSWGNGRGYIWSRSLPMIKDTFLLGHGADTFCIYFPHNDYVGKYNSGSYTEKIDVIVDKPHNMYLGMAIGTGVISMLALLVLWGIYIVQSFLIYRRERYSNLISYCGAGIFLGICGFLVAGLVNDSSVSVMPMFYGLLGTGISINMMLKNSSI